MLGKSAMEEYGEENVSCFADNSIEKQSEGFCSKEVVSLTKAAEIVKSGKARLVIASQYVASMEKDLKELGVAEYGIFRNRLRGIYETDELIYNPYEIDGEAKTEEEWREGRRFEYARRGVYEETERMHGKDDLFNHIEIETINRCNGACSFCPVNSASDPREKAVMHRSLFYSIVEQLEELDYAGRFATFSNNEPLLDGRIIELNRYARDHLPHARMHLYTNGTLMTLDIFKELVDILDELIIDNYRQDLKLIKPCIEIQEYVKNHPGLAKKVTIVLRKPQEILTSRGGNAPNRKEPINYGKDRCVLPFKQMIIRPDGKVSLCCNDALGKYTLGDLTKENLTDIWFGPRFMRVRECLYEGRENWGDCRRCDTFNMG